MFKGILPSKRVVSSDFTFLTNLAVDVPAGKENQPTSGVQHSQIPATKVGKVGAAMSKKKRGDAKKPKDIPLEVPETNQAFDKLLVRPIFITACLVVNDMFRMISRFL